MALLKSIVEWLKTYCSDILLIDNEIRFSFSDVRMRLSVDAFINQATIAAEVFDLNNTQNGYDDGLELANVMNRNLNPYTFVWDECDGTIEAHKDFVIRLNFELDFIIKVEIYRLFYLCHQVEKVHCMYQVSDFPDDKNWMQFLLSVVDKWVAADLLNINILYLHGFASSGNSGTAKVIQDCLPQCNVISPDLPINAVEALEVVQKTSMDNRIDIVIGTSMGGLLALFANCNNIIVVNPSFHVSQMMNQLLGENESVTVPFFNKREDGKAEFELTCNIANDYYYLETNIQSHSRLNSANILGLFGTEYDAVDCKEEFLKISPNIRHFKGGNRLNREAIEEVVVPSILQMVIDMKFAIRLF